MGPLSSTTLLPVLSLSALTYYLNGGFDLNLRGPVPRRLQRLVPEMTAWLIPVAGPSDRVILDIPVPPEYLGYLRFSGFTPPLIGRENSCGRSTEGVAWGYDRLAVERLRSTGAKLNHPPLDVVRTVNSRTFSHELAHTLHRGVPHSQRCSSAEEADEYLKHAPQWPVVIKPEFGSAGIDFRRIDSTSKPAIGVEHVRTLLQEGNSAVVLEPWLPRRLDISTRFELDARGNVSGIKHARGVVSSSGASLGVMYGPDDPLIAPHYEQLDGLVQAVAHAMAREGYFGPVNIDSMVTGSDADSTLVPLLEINARQSLSYIAYCVAERLRCNRWFMLRTVSTARAALPSSYVELARVLRRIGGEPGVHHGILALTPLRIPENGSFRSPYRAIFFVYGRTEDKVRTLGHSLGRRLGRTRP